jgi:hypothetical protein
MINKEILSPEIEEIGTTSDSYYMAAVSIFLIIVFMLMIKRQSSTINPEFINQQDL